MHRRNLRYRKNPPLPWLAMPVKVIKDQTIGSDISVADS